VACCHTLTWSDGYLSLVAPWCKPHRKKKTAFALSRDLRHFADIAVSVESVVVAVDVANIAVPRVR